MFSFRCTLTNKQINIHLLPHLFILKLHKQINKYYRTLHINIHNTGLLAISIQKIFIIKITIKLATMKGEAIVTKVRRKKKYYHVQFLQ